MFWGCFSNLGLGPLVALEGSQNQHTYVELLKEYLVPEILEAERSHGDASCHKTKKVMDFLAKEGVSTLEWPPQSPDLNPIENLWAIIKKRRQKKYGFPSTKIDLINQIYEIWDEIDIELCVKLSKSITNRLEAVVKQYGRQTKY